MGADQVVGLEEAGPRRVLTESTGAAPNGDALNRALAWAERLAQQNVQTSQGLRDHELEVVVLLERAGLERAPDGALYIRDSASIGRSDEVKGLSSAEQVFGTSETRLGPPCPARIELSREALRGGESFAYTLDRAFNELVFVNFPGVAEGRITDGTAGAEAFAKLPSEDLDVRRIAELTADVLLAIFLKLNITDPNNSVDTHNTLLDSASILRQAGLDAAKAAARNAAEQMREAEAYASRAQAYSDMMGTVMTAFSMLTAVFSFGTTFIAQQMVTEAVKQAVQQAVQEAVRNAVQQAIKESTKELVQQQLQQIIQQATQDAIQKLIQDGVLKQGMEKAVQEVVQKGVVEGCRNAGVECSQEIAVQASRQAMDGAFEEILKETLELLSGVVQLGGHAGQAVANYEVQMRMLDAQSKLLDAKRLRMMAETEQARVEEEQEIIKAILESKNAVVEAVLKMLQAQLSTNLRIQSAGMSR